MSFALPYKLRLQLFYGLFKLLLRKKMGSTYCGRGCKNLYQLSSAYEFKGKASALVHLHLMHAYTTFSMLLYIYIYNDTLV